MAELNLPWSTQQTWAQYAAIARLRWRMLVNISKRSNTPGEVAGRVVLYLVLLTFGSLLTFAAGAAAWLVVSADHLNRLWLVFWGIFIMCQLLNLNLGQPGTTFDPTELIRFPLRVPTYIAIRLFFNLLSPANVMAALMSAAAAAGIAIAQPALWLYALLACAVFAITNVLFSRMIFAWIDRWLSTRRARELFTATIFLVSLGFQYVNITYNPAYGRSHSHRHTDAAARDNAAAREKLNAAAAFYHRAEPKLRFLPPNLAGESLQAAAAGQPSSFAANVAGCGVYAALFLCVFALRMRAEFHGESLSDTASASSLPATRPRTASPVLPDHAARAGVSAQQIGLLPAPLVALLRKEWTYMRRNTGLLYGLVTPLFLVVLFALRMGRNMTSPWIVPIAIAYSLVGIAPMSYNSFGVDGVGAQVYFMAPVPLQSVFLAKNILHFAIALLEVVVVVVVMGYVSRLPPTMTIVGILLWACGSLLLNTALGNRRSISAPKKVDLSRMARRQASQTSALMSLGILAACVGYGAGILILAGLLHLSWLPLLGFAALAAVGFVVYRNGLRSLQDFTFAHRDTLFEELGKA